MKKYTPRDGKIVEYFFRKNGFPTAKLIGSLGRGKNSNNDIDILLPYAKNTLQLRQKLIYLLEPKKDFVDTDWGGLFFYDTFFGNVDIFFTTKDFDY